MLETTKSPPATDDAVDDTIVAVADDTLSPLSPRTRRALSSEVDDDAATELCREDTRTPAEASGSTGDCVCASVRGAMTLAPALLTGSRDPPNCRDRFDRPPTAAAGMRDDTEAAGDARAESGVRMAAPPDTRVDDGDTTCTSVTRADGGLELTTNASDVMERRLATVVAAGAGEAAPATAASSASPALATDAVARTALAGPNKDCGRAKLAPPLPLMSVRDGKPIGEGAGKDVGPPGVGMKTTEAGPATAAGVEIMDATPACACDAGVGAIPPSMLLPVSARAVGSMLVPTRDVVTAVGEPAISTAAFVGVDAPASGTLTVAGASVLVACTMATTGDPPSPTAASTLTTAGVVGDVVEVSLLLVEDVGDVALEVSTTSGTAVTTGRAGPRLASDRNGSVVGVMDVSGMAARPEAADSTPSNADGAADVAVALGADERAVVICNGVRVAAETAETAACACRIIHSEVTFAAVTCACPAAVENGTEHASGARPYTSVACLPDAPARAAVLGGGGGAAITGVATTPPADTGADASKRLPTVIVMLPGGRSVVGSGNSVLLAGGAGALTGVRPAALVEAPLPCGVWDSSAHAARLPLLAARASRSACTELLTAPCAALPAVRRSSSARLRSASSSNLTALDSAISAAKRADSSLGVCGAGAVS